MGRAKTNIEMGQLNLYLPKWQIDELERLAQLNRTTRAKYSHKVLADHIKPKPVLREEGQAQPEPTATQDVAEWEEVDTKDIEGILKF
jgi:hypothetical protein